MYVWRMAQSLCPCSKPHNLIVYNACDLDVEFDVRYRHFPLFGLYSRGAGVTEEWSFLETNVR